MKNKLVLVVFGILTLQAFSDDSERIVITGSRIDYNNSPSVTMTKPADFLIQRITLTNDSRDYKRRENELTLTVKDILKRAKSDKKIEVSVGNEVAYPISLENLQLDFQSGKRNDTSFVSLLIKTPIKQKDNVENLVMKIDTFIAGIDRVGRSEVIKKGELVLSIKNPRKYRSELLKLIATDIRDTVGIFGENYTAEIHGLSQAIQWERVSVSELRLYLEYDFVLSHQ